MNLTDEATIMGLCLDLMAAGTEAEAVAILKAAGLWDAPEHWRHLGDLDNNFSSIGNQQSEAVAALIEKIINAVDSMLLSACLARGIDPEGDAAPTSLREAVARLFEGRSGTLRDADGRVAFWDDTEVTKLGRLITVAASGLKPPSNPCLSIADAGEGQTPDSFPDTFMSLHRSNKLRVPFVQGKFNMGGTGALMFCGGDHNLQLVVSRRNPALQTADAADRDRQWGFTVVRREPPTGSSRSSVFTYLAPVGADARRLGRVLAFAAASMPIFPEANKDVRDAHARPAEHGSLVKLFEYNWQGTKTNIVSGGDGLLRRLDQGMPEVALPIRVYECRSEYRGHSGSFATNVLGLGARLERDRAEKLEPTFPRSSIINIDGDDIVVRVFAFKKGEADAYRSKRQAVILAVNGQSHAYMPTDFFRRSKVQMDYLADSLLVTVDCSSVRPGVRERLFMNSRDRLRDDNISNRLIDELENLLREDAALRELRARRRQEDLAEKLSDEKPLASALHDLLRSSPTLSAMFLTGKNLPAPFKPKGSADGDEAPFKGLTYPTFIRWRSRATGEDLVREVGVGSRVRLRLETDAENGYFDRLLDPATKEVWRVEEDGSPSALRNYRLDGPVEGIMTLTFQLPDDLQVGDHLAIEVEVDDSSRFEPIVNRAQLSVVSPHGTERRPRPPTGGIALPRIERVHEADWGTHSFHTFNEQSALVLVATGDSENGVDIYDFYVNVDNKYLRTVQKGSPRTDPNLLEAKFVYALVLIGLAVLHDASQKNAPSDVDDASDAPVTDGVRRISEALAPVLLPMVDTIGSLSLDD
ncbi:MAG: hypothetical protein M3355_04230 [Actinomycetota bacterium]|nr:hypothetical protein [Actinomycetota bacterium]